MPIRLRGPARELLVRCCRVSLNLVRALLRKAGHGATVHPDCTPATAMRR